MYSARDADPAQFLMELPLLSTWQRYQAGMLWPSQAAEPLDISNCRKKQVEFAMQPENSTSRKKSAKMKISSWYYISSRRTADPALGVSGEALAGRERR